MIKSIQSVLLNISWGNDWVTIQDKKDVFFLHVTVFFWCVCFEHEKISGILTLRLLHLLFSTYWNFFHLHFQEGETALHKACRKCHYPVVKELLHHAKLRGEQECQAFVCRTNREGECALHYCGKIKKSSLHFPKEDAMIMKLLMEHGSDVMAQTKEVIKPGKSCPPSHQNRLFSRKVARQPTYRVYTNIQKSR